jgi:hypothetical protein
MSAVNTLSVSNPRTSSASAPLIDLDRHTVEYGVTACSVAPATRRNTSCQAGGGSRTRSYMPLTSSAVSAPSNPSRDEPVRPRRRNSASICSTLSTLSVAGDGRNVPAIAAFSRVLFRERARVALEGSGGAGMRLRKGGEMRARGGDRTRNQCGMSGAE